MNNRATGLPLLASILLHIMVLSALALYEGTGPAANRGYSPAKAVIVHIVEAGAGPVRFNTGTKARQGSLSKGGKEIHKKVKRVKTTPPHTSRRASAKKETIKKGRSRSETILSGIKKISVRKSPRPLPPPAKIPLEKGAVKSIAAVKESQGKTTVKRVGLLVKGLSKRRSREPERLYHQDPPPFKSLIEEVAERYKTGVRRRSKAEFSNTFIKKVSKRRTLVQNRPSEAAASLPAVIENAADENKSKQAQLEESVTPPPSGALDAASRIPASTEPFSGPGENRASGKEVLASKDISDVNPESQTVPQDGPSLKELKESGGASAGTLEDYPDGTAPSKDGKMTADLEDGYGVQEGPYTTPASIIVKRRPYYPWRSRLRGEEGTVVIEVEILPDGRRGSIEILSSSGHPLLDRAALRALERARFVPATKNGAAVRSKKKIAFTFRIEEAR